MDMVLAKTDLAIASRYAELVPDRKLRERIFKRIVGEYERTSTVLDGDHRRKGTLADNPLLARSIKNRFAYLDPLNHLQVELIKRHRARRQRTMRLRSAGSTCRSTALRRACAIPAEVIQPSRSDAARIETGRHFF